MKKINKLLNILLLLIAVIAGAAFFVMQNRDVSNPVSSKTVKKIGAPSEKVDEVVNKYMKQVQLDAIKQDIQMQKVMIDTKYKLSELERKKKLEQEKADAQVPLEKQIWKESDFKKEENSKTTQASNSSGAMTPEEKEEYKRQFIENARRDGVLIELSDDLEVIRAVPLDEANNKGAKRPDSANARRPSRVDDSIDPPIPSE